jgi:hypothetical protein
MTNPMTIYKYNLPINDIVKIDMPKLAVILTAQMQRNNICLWAIVNPLLPWETRTFRVYGTGHPMDEGWEAREKYISTVQELGGALVWHIFEVTQ